MQDLILPITLVFAFVATVLAIQAGASILFASRARRQRVNRRLTLLESGIPAKQVYESLVRRQSTSGLGGIGGRLFDRAGLYLSQAGLTVSPMRLLAYAGGAVGVLWLLSTFVLGARSLQDTLTALVAATVLVSAVVWVWVSRQHAQRKKLLEEQLPLALDIIIRAIRAGHPVVSAVHLVTQEMGDPIGSEFGLIVDETTYGFEFREALANFARRTGSEDAHFFAVSVGIQSETGGNLAEILANLTNVIRGRITLGKRVQALASEGRMSAVVLSLLPLFLISFVGLTQPAFYTSKFADPIFWPVVTLTLILYAIGQVVMHRIVNFKY
ncbi:type II secretion system F family protein [Phenylobacterium sp. LH3H17]|uniref:type II secretion system F family protein n=1 Tax=Phenylobacterium sp. LH3H17 TaxID=2903901 RepID=UPI0020C9520D|nr:type II secretion system F family protein [Phenylobacterium sp. LH3H17]UTP38830.1 type II secretion system F family protein [Phenylobacterium sp. LH3H17]